MIMIDTLRTFDAGKGKTGSYFSLPALEEEGLGKISRLPVSIRIVLESAYCTGEAQQRYANSPSFCHR